MNGSSAPALSVHADFIKSQLPAWLTSAPEASRKALRESLLKSNQSRHDLKAFLKQLKGPEAFARPLLRKHLRRRFPVPPIDETAILSREWKHHHLLGLIKTHAQTTEHSLLEAALQNFEEEEADEHGMEEGTCIYTLHSSGRRRSIVSPTEFAELCRSLDLGEQYQDHLEQVLDRTYTLRMTSKVQKLFVEQAKNAFAVTIHLAFMDGSLPSNLYQPLLTLAQDGRHADITCSHLTIDGVVLPSVLVIQCKANDSELLLYTPEDPQAPVRRHACLEELESQLVERLNKSAEYTTFFKSLVPLQYQETLLKIRPAWRDWFSVGAKGTLIPISLESSLTCTEIQVHVFLAVSRQRINQIKNDARAIAVPTADVDLVARRKRLQAYADLGKSVLFFAASFVPLVGEVLLVVCAAQLLGTVYHGFAAWSRGDSEEALNDLLDVVDNVALAAVTAGVVKTVGFTAGLVRVKLRQGGERLWKPDLQPYRQTATALPAGLAADAEGIYSHEAQHYLKLDDHLHAVKRDPKSQQWQLQHPSDSGAYTPPLLSNGVGGWRHLHESARDWDDLKLIKRLGPDAANISEPQVEPILLLSGLDSTTLRQAHEEAVRPPPLLRDTVKRFNLEQEIDAFDCYRAEGSEVTPSTPYIQLHLVTSLPQWPQGRVLNVVDEQGATVVSRGSGDSELKVPLARFKRGDLLHYLEQHLPTGELNELLPASPNETIGTVENLAQRLADEARQHRQPLFNWLEQTLNTPPSSPAAKEMARLMPGLSKSHLEEMMAVLSPEQQRRLLLEKSLTSQQHWEADQYLQQLRTCHAFASLHLESTATSETPAMILATLERVPGWPAKHPIEVREQNSTGALLASTGPQDATTRHLIVREGEQYRLQPAPGQSPQVAGDLIAAIIPTLSTRDLMSVLQKSEVRTLQEAMHKAGLGAMANHPPAFRTKLVRSGSFPTGNAIDPLFADPKPPEGLVQRTDGIHLAPALPDGSIRCYVLINAKYYRVKLDGGRWRLLDNRSLFRAYQPYIRQRPEGGWQLDESIDSPPSLGMKSADEQLVQAEPASEPEATEDASTAYTPDELSRMRSNNNYLNNQNYRRIYDRTNNGRYPLRDLEGRPMRIRFIQSIGTSGQSAEAFNKDKILPFIQWEGFEKVAKLYDAKLKTTAFTAAHQRFPEESGLIGQLTVVTTRAIKKGEALGVYGGELVPLRIAGIRHDPYLLDVFVQRSKSTMKGGNPASGQIDPDTVLSGDNVLSRINTLFEYENGRPVRQASTGYNVVSAGFQVDAQAENQPMVRLEITGFFANEDLKPGTELRWNYGYDEASIRQLFERLL